MLFMIGVCTVLYSTLLYSNQVKLPAEKLPNGNTHWDEEFEFCATMRSNNNSVSAAYTPVDGTSTNEAALDVADEDSGLDSSDDNEEKIN